MPAIFAHGGDAQGVALIAFGERDNRLWHRGGKQQRAPFGRRRVEQFFEIITKAHVEHFIGFIEHRDFQRRQVERAAFQMVPQTPRRADNDMRAMAQHPPFAAGIHAANACRNARAGCLIQPQ